MRRERGRVRVQVKMYPQLFWGVLACLQAVHVPLFALVLRAFSALLGSLQLWNLPCQQILQASAPLPRPDVPLPSGAPRALSLCASIDSRL
jgi:Cell morphogenesis C-terminal